MCRIPAWQLFAICVLTWSTTWHAITYQIGVASPEFGVAHEGQATALGAAFTVGSVLLSTVGSLVASRNRERGLSMWPSLGYGMVYGAITCLAVVLASGPSLVWPTALSWWLALVYLALAGSVLTFACYLTLLERLGVGVLLAVAGNVLMLIRRAAPAGGVKAVRATE